MESSHPLKGMFYGDSEMMALEGADRVRALLVKAKVYWETKVFE